MGLDKLNINQPAKIITVDASKVIKLMTLGLIEGEIITIVNSGIGGDPLELSIRGSSIVINREQAKYFNVEPILLDKYNKSVIESQKLKFNQLFKILCQNVLNIIQKK